MSARKNTPKTALPEEMLQSLPKELSYIRQVAIKMLKIIDKEMSGKASVIKERQQYDKFFGSKNSLADTLVTLADLILRLTPEYRSNAGDGQPPEMNEHDKLLVEAFIARKKAGDTPKAQG